MRRPTGSMPPISTSASGCVTPSFIRSRMVVPPARNCTAAIVGGPPPSSRAAVTASASSAGRRYMKARNGSAPHLALGLVDCLYDVGVGGTPAQVPAHVLPDFRIVGGMPLVDAADRRHDLPRRAIAALKP